MDKLHYFPCHARKVLASNKIRKMSGDAFKAYWMLICSSWFEDERATLANDVAELQALSLASDKVWAKVATEVMACFVDRGDGRIYSEFLMDVSLMQEKKQKAGSIGGSNKQANRVAEAKQTPSKRSSYKSKSNSKSNSKEIREDSINEALLPFLSLAASFHDIQKENYPKQTVFKPSLRAKADLTGAEALEKLHRIDGWSMDDIKTILDWIPDNEFWCMNIRSLGNIRNTSKNGAKKIENAQASMQQEPKSTADMVAEARGK